MRKKWGKEKRNENEKKNKTGSKIPNNLERKTSESAPDFDPTCDYLSRYLTCGLLNPITLATLVF